MGACWGGAGRGRDKDGEEEARDKIFFGCGSEQSEASGCLNCIIIVIGNVNCGVVFLRKNKTKDTMLMPCLA